MIQVLDSGPFDRPFDKLMVLSEVEGLTALSKVERLRRNDSVRQGVLCRGAIHRALVSFQPSPFNYSTI